MTEDHLARVESDLAAIRSRCRTRRGASRRAVIHCHTALSHDSDGNIDQMARAAVATGTEVVMVTDHAREDLDVIGDGFRGSRAGVQFIPGAEAKHLLIFRAEGLDLGKSQRELLGDVRRSGGMAFLSHLEGQGEWDLEGLAGTEVYNMHASFQGQERLSGLLRPRTAADFGRLYSILLLLHEHPDGGFASFCEVPDLYLSHWDALNTAHRLAGIAANDSHANTEMKFKQGTSGAVDVLDFRGNAVARIPAEIASSCGIGEAVFSPDRYEVSFGHVGTHVCTASKEESSLFESLAEGNCHIGFDWIADTSSFTYGWETSRRSGPQGGEISLEEAPVLLAELPTGSELVLKRDGEAVASTTSDSLEYRPEQPGDYRLEASLEVAGERRPWIYSNPIRVVETRTRP